MSGLILSFTQPLCNTIVGVQAIFRVSYPNRVITRVKGIDYIGKGIFNSHLGSNSFPCYIQNCVLTNRVIKRFGTGVLLPDLDRRLKHSHHTRTQSLLF